MLKMFSTQLTGLMNRIQEKEEFSFEDGARLLTQAAIGDGNIFIFGQGEMESIISEALYSMEPLPNAKRWDGKTTTITEADRVLIFSRFSHDEAAVQAGRWLYENRIPFVAVSTDMAVEEDTLVNLADVHINLHLKKGLLPTEDGNRIGYPASMAALFVYYGLKFTINEILEDY